MAHVRKLIRDHITTSLTGLTTTGSNVFQTRFFPLEDTKLPRCAFTQSPKIPNIDNDCAANTDARVGS